MLFARQQNNQTGTAEEDVKDVVGRRATGETLLRRDQKPGDARQNKHRSEDGQGYEVDTLLIDWGPRILRRVGRADTIRQATLLDGKPATKSC